MSDEQDNDQDVDDDMIIKCWCGAEGTYKELFDPSVYDRPCGGTGMLDCECGGDICICHNHGEIECPGCEDCAYDDDDWDEDYE